MINRILGIGLMAGGGFKAIKKYHTEPQRTQRGVKAFLFFVIFVPLCGFIKKISHKAAENTKGAMPFFLFFVIFVPLCGFIKKISHRAAKNTKGRKSLSFLCDLCAFV